MLPFVVSSYKVKKINGIFFILATGFSSHYKNTVFPREGNGL